MNVDQGILNRVLQEYLDNTGRKNLHIVDERGNCHGWEFIFQVYLSGGKKAEFNEILNFLAILKTDNLDEAEKLFQKTTILNDKYQGRTKLDENNLPIPIRGVEVFLEQTINDLVIFHFLTDAAKQLKLNLRQESRLEQYELVKDITQDRQLKKVFSYPQMSLDLAQLEQMLTFCSCNPKVSIDILMPQHTIGFYITEEGKFEYFDSNFEGGIQSFDSPKQLAEAIKSSYEKVVKLQEGKMVLDLNAHKFYAKNEIIPLFETATPIAKSQDTQTDLSHAVMRNDTEKVAELMTNKEMTETDIYGKTPVEWAIIMGNPLIVKQFIDAGLKVNSPLNTTMTETPLQIAFKTGNQEIRRQLITAWIDEIIQTGADIDETDSYGQSALHLAAAYGLNDDVKRLLDRGANIELKSGSFTPLMSAIGGDNPQVVKQILSAGVTVNREMGEISPLLLAAKRGNAEIVRLLLAADANIETVDYEYNTPLQLASEEGNKEVVEILIKDWIKKLMQEGQDINASDPKRRTALSWAAENGLNAEVEQLLKAGAHPDLLDADNRTPLMKAAREGHEEVVKTLLAKGVKIDLVDDYGNSALMNAVKSGHNNVVRELLAADPDKSFLAYGPILLQAAKGKNEEIVLQLIAKGANLDYSEPSSGQTPLMWAVMNNRKEIVVELVKAGADIHKLNKDGSSALSLAENCADKAAMIALLQPVKISKENKPEAPPMAEQKKSRMQILTQYTQRTSSAQVQNKGITAEQKSEPESGKERKLR